MWSAQYCDRCAQKFAKRCRRGEVVNPPGSVRMATQEEFENSIRKVLSETTRQGKPRTHRTKKADTAV